MITTLLVILAMLAACAFYVAGEFAAVGVRRSQIRQLAEQGHVVARQLLPYLDDPRQLDRYIAVSQVGITLSSLLLGAVGQARLNAPLAALLERWAGLAPLAAVSTAALIILISLTVVQVLFSELVPKSIALQFPTQTALYTSVPMRWSLQVLTWPIALLNGCGLLLLRLFRVPAGGHRHIHSPDEIDLLIAESRDGGLLEPDEQERLHRALQLGARPVHQLMVPRRRMDAVDLDRPTAEIVQQVLDSPYTRLPVYRGTVDNVVGLLHTKDLVRQVLEHGTVTQLDRLIRPLCSVPDSIAADRLIHLLRERHCTQALVVDEFGGVSGLVTSEDILSELLGDVADEFKTEGPQPERLPDGQVRLPGLLRRDEVDAWLGRAWPGSADTVGGHVMDMLGHLPQAGETLEIEGLSVLVERMEQHAVASVLVVPASTTPGPATTEGAG